MPDNSQIFHQAKSFPNLAREYIRFYVIASNINVAYEKVFLGCLGFIV